MIENLDKNIKEKYKKLNICGIHCLSLITGINFIIIYNTIKHNNGILKINDIIEWLTIFKIPYKCPQYINEDSKSKYLIITNDHAYVYLNDKYFDQTGNVNFDKRKKIQILLEFPIDYRYNYEEEFRKLIERQL